MMVAVALHVTSAKHMKSQDNNCVKFTQAVNALCIDASVNSIQLQVFPQYCIVVSITYTTLYL